MCYILVNRKTGEVRRGSQGNIWRFLSYHAASQWADETWKVKKEQLHT